MLLICMKAIHSNSLCILRQVGTEDPVSHCTKAISIFFTELIVMYLSFTPVTCLLSHLHVGGTEVRPFKMMFKICFKYAR